MGTVFSLFNTSLFTCLRDATFLYFVRCECMKYTIHFVKRRKGYQTFIGKETRLYKAFFKLKTFPLATREIVEF